MKEIENIFENNDPTIANLFSDGVYDLQRDYDNKTISDIDFINGLDQIIDEINDYIDGIDYYQNQQDLQDLINNSEEVN